MLQDYCNDRATSAARADGVLKANLPAYTVAELEAHHLWSRLEAKAASLGGCSQILGRCNPTSAR